MFVIAGIIAIIVIVSALVGLLVLSKPDYTIDQIINRFNNEGILVNMATISSVCGGYIEVLKNSKDKCLTELSDCSKLVDMTDPINILNNGANIGGLSCFALDTTFLQKDLPVQVFGPLPGIWGEMAWPIGLIFDRNKLLNYAVCMGVVDSGSVSRYGPYMDYSKAPAFYPSDAAANPNDPIYKVDTNVLTNEYAELTNSSGKYGAAMAAAGCAPINNFKVGDSFDLATGPLTIPWQIPAGWSTPYNQGSYPYDFSKYRLFPRTKWDDWKTSLIEVSKTLATQVVPSNFDPNYCQSAIQSYFDLSSGKSKDPNNAICFDYWANQFAPNSIDGYRENEVDIFIPQSKPPTGSVADHSLKCQPTDQAVQDLRDAIIGVFVNDMCGDDVRLNNQRMNSWSSSCCKAAPDFKYKIARWLADSYNKNKNSKHKIHAYSITTVNPGLGYDDWIKNGYQSKLDIRYI